MAAQGFTQHSGEHMMKMMLRKAGQSGEIFQGQRFVQVLLDMHQHAQEALLVETQRGLLCRNIHLAGMFITSGGQWLDSFCDFSSCALCVRWRGWTHLPFVEIFISRNTRKNPAKSKRSAIRSFL
jgi:hypothetical protein